ncbi:MAG: hypothetical protein COX57_03620 [Alphaproteobacteria bacterium CG_4_10_14_0_2_um_filter_63_37]|nr:MAG: hypothetical protein AUJ55_11380 [Proteobacteria bacterium CG1_02_64_396]PJA25386.1 MAG: hypothetical protein COX57_03620 [Alphaproteobacteria bacterium CG_4_10_14_0_2_um_filter_63_37]
MPVLSDVRMAFFGDSLTQGTGDPTGMGWVGRVVARLWDEGIPVTGYNLGVRRETSADIAQRWRSEAALRLPPRIEGRVIFCFGVNDTASEGPGSRLTTAQTLAHAAAMLRGANAHYPTLMLGPPPVLDAAHNDRVLALTEALEGLCCRLEIPFIPLAEPLLGDDRYLEAVRSGPLADESHPGAEGYIRIAEEILAHPAWWFAAAGKGGGL